MLLREDAFKLLDYTEQEEIARVMRQALEMRIRFPEVIRFPRFLRSDLYYIPACHAISHAFARVFGHTAVDGEHQFAKRVDLVDGGKDMDVVSSTMTHAWVEFETRGSTRFILDVFPDQGLAIFPVIYRAPHPSYWVPTESERTKILAAIKTNRFEREVAAIAEIMKEIAQERNLFQIAGI